MIKIVKLFSYQQMLGVICPFPGLYTCKIMKYSKFISETASPIFTRFHMGPSIEEILTICSNGSVRFNKMAVKPIYGKTLTNLLRQYTKKALRLNLGIQHWGLKFYQVSSSDETRIIFDLLMVWSKLCPSYCGNTGRMLNDICKYATAVFIR